MIVSDLFHFDSLQLSYSSSEKFDSRYFGGQLIKNQRLSTHSDALSLSVSNKKGVNK